MSFSDECNYLVELISNTKEKLKDPNWKWLGEDFFKEEIIQLERKLYLIKEQELCQKLNSINRTSSISTFLSISQS